MEQHAARLLWPGIDPDPRRRRGSAGCGGPTTFDEGVAAVHGRGRCRINLLDLADQSRNERQHIPERATRRVGFTGVLSFKSARRIAGDSPTCPPPRLIADGIRPAHPPGVIVGRATGALAA